MTRRLAVIVLTSVLAASPAGAASRSEPVEELVNSVGMKLRYIQPGEFVMGSGMDAEIANTDEMPQHMVCITRGFYMGRTEVTTKQFAVFAGEAVWETQAEREDWSYAWHNGSFQIVRGRSFRDPGFTQTDDHPVVCVSWHDAAEFCRWLGHREARRYRLPTEAEWEYACRAGTKAVYQWGDRPEDGLGWCNVADETARPEFANASSPAAFFPWSDGHIFTAPVGRFRPNPFGLYDMHGNVLEFCQDWYRAGYGTVTSRADPTGPERGEFRVLRGGSWSSYRQGCRSAKRYRDRPSIRCSNLGFRVVLELE